MSDVAALVAREVTRFPAEVPSLPVTPDTSPAEIRARLALYDFASPRPMADVVPDVMLMLRDWTTHCTHPRYFGLFNPSVHEAGVWADTLAALYNPQVGAWAHAPAANEIERHMLRYFMTLLGVDSDAWAAHFTTGGSEANQTAVVAALASRLPGFVERGAGGLEARPTIYVSSESHHSFWKIVRVTGLGERALRIVQADRALRFDVASLRRQLDSDAASGHQPVMVVGTLGTTGAGVIDPLPELATVCRERGLWLHVDAAWGGGATLSPALRRFLAGVELADSLTWDAHKWLSVPMGAGMFFTRHPDALRRAFDVDASYVPPGLDEVDDLYLTTLQWSRRFIGLKVFLTMVTEGGDGMRARIEHQVAMGDALRARLVTRGWTLVNETPLPLVCFTHPSIRAGAVSTTDIVSRVRASGLAWISDVVVGGTERVLRACVTSFRTSEADLDILVDAVDRVLREDPSVRAPAAAAAG
jgi:aromatic-L-amino-acid decarboxylase